MNKSKILFKLVWKTGISFLLSSVMINLCSSKLTPEAVNDSPSTFMAVVTIDTDNNTSCGGTQIHPRFVLTAAHCVDSPYNVLVLLGVWNITSESHSFFNITRDNVLMHHDYNTVTLENDIALIKLPKVTTDSAIVPIADCIYLMDAFCHSHGGTAEAMGFEFEMNDTVLVENVTLTKCRPTDLIFCDCPSSSREVFSVDNGVLGVGWSGGPLLWNDMQFGIISGGEKICSQEMVVQFTNVLHYLGWIEEYVTQAELDEIEGDDFSKYNYDEYHENFVYY